jgi:hypothetical protein
MDVEQEQISFLFENLYDLDITDPRRLVGLTDVLRHLAPFVADRAGKSLLWKPALLFSSQVYRTAGSLAST